MLPTHSHQPCTANRGWCEDTGAAQPFANNEFLTGVFLMKKLCLLKNAFVHCAFVLFTPRLSAISS
jgi:hypothetical protein